MRLRSSGCHGRGRSALPRYDAPPAWRKPVSHGPAEQRVRWRVVKDGHREPVAMARTLLGARAGQGGRERLQAAALIAPAQRSGGRGAAGGGKGRVHCLYSVRGKRAAGPHHARDATLRGRGAPGRPTPAARARAGAAGRWARAAGGGFPAGRGADTEEGARARRARWGDPGCAGSGAPTAAAAGQCVAAALTRAPPSGIVVLHGGPAYGERRSIWMPTSPTSHSPTAQSAVKEIPC
jgi:hypothetical protein